ncbi:MAG: hypothetical protein DRP35_01105 [Candidatus Zixiibacteriota bacterium]|nr:MAG: hypothetical protein DRP35_01105 [candidate division Zixibacteria bacterium]
MVKTIEKEISGNRIDSNMLDLSYLVGREIFILCDQFTGKKLSSKVIMINEKRLSLDRGMNSDFFDQLGDNQDVTVFIKYKGQEISVGANLKRALNGQCTIILDNNIIPFTRRKYQRFTMSDDAKLAVISSSITDPKFTAKLSWKESSIINVSCGGVMLSVSSLLMKGTKVFLNLPLQNFSLPKLILAQVVHCYQEKNNRFSVGMEFIINEEKKNHFNQQSLELLPAAVLKFNKTKRSEMNEKLVSWMKNRDDLSEGVTDES